MTIEDIEKARELLREFIPYEEGQKIRQELHQHALNSYAPKYADKYMEFMNNNECSFKVVHSQSMNFPYYMGLFTEVSQHIYADSIEGLLDLAIEADIRGMVWG